MQVAYGCNVVRVYLCLSVPLLSRVYSFKLQGSRDPWPYNLPRRVGSILEVFVRSNVHKRDKIRCALLMPDRA